MSLSIKILPAISYPMSLSIKILPLVALAIALSPPAAQAHSAKATSQAVRVSEITPSSATIDNPTTVYGGVNANSFRDSVSG
jgi:hypothetical protein